MVPIRGRLSLLFLFSPFRAFGGCSSLANITSRITTVGALRIDIWIASRQLASHRVQSVTSRVHECPDLMKTTLRKSLEKIARKTRNSGGKCRNEGLTSEARRKREIAHPRATPPRKRTRPLPDVAHAADRAAYPSHTAVKFWCSPVEAIRRNSSLAETSLTYPLRKRIEALDGRHKRRWRYEKSIQGVKRALLKKNKSYIYPCGGACST